MPKFVMADCSGGGIDGDLLDACREAQTTEVRCWRVVGPLNVNGKQCFKAQRDADGAPADQTEIQYMDFTEKSYAVDFIMWRGLQAAIEHFKKETGPKLILSN